MSPGPEAALQLTVTGAATLPDSSTAKLASSPSVTVAGATDTVTAPASVIVVVADVEDTLTAPFAVVAPVSITSSVSPGSRTSSASVSMTREAPDAPPAMVSVPAGSA